MKDIIEQFKIFANNNEIPIVISDEELTTVLYSDRVESERYTPLNCATSDKMKNISDNIVNINRVKRF